MQGRDKEVREGEDVETVLRGFISTLSSATQPAPGPTTDNSHTHAGAPPPPPPPPPAPGGFQGDGRRSRRYTNLLPFPPRVSPAEDSLSAPR